MKCAENDQLFPAAILEDGRKHLESNHVEHEIHLYPEVPHGNGKLQRTCLVYDY
jgi:hypothetical protein